MRLFSKMLTRKPTEEEAMGKLDLDDEFDAERRLKEAEADDSGQINPSRLKSSRASTESANPFDAVSDEPITARAEEPEEAEGAGWGASAFSEDDWDDDDDWGDEEAADTSHIKDDIREAVSSTSQTESDAAPASAPTTARVGSVGSKSEGRPWTDEGGLGRRAIARSRIGSQVDGSEDRLMSKTDNKFDETESTRRRSALAHLKRAAAATKADKVLSHVVGRDPSSDPDEQSPYRDDLAKVVRPHSGSRPISRPVSRDQTIADPWDEGPSDEDAAMFAAASEAPDDRSAADTFDPLAHVPANLSAEDFADDFDEPENKFALNEKEAEQRFTDPEPEPKEEPVMNIGAGLGDDFDDAEDDFEFENEDAFASEEDDFEEDLTEDDAADTVDYDAEDYDGPVPSTAVADAIAIANGEMEFEDEEEEDDVADDDAAIRSQIAGFGGASVGSGEPTPTPSEPEDFVNVAAAIPSAGAARPGRGAGRVKTRLLGFQPEEEEKDVFEAAKQSAGPGATEYPVGWILVLEGPGRGKCFTVFTGVSNIGRGEDQAVRLDFGDTSISRNNHAAVAFDVEERKFFLGHGGKSNLVRLNGKPVLSTEEMSDGDEIRIGETTLKFVALCGPDFAWTDGPQQ